MYDGYTISIIGIVFGTTKGECREDIIYTSTVSRKNMYNRYTTKGECREDTIYTSKGSRKKIYNIIYTSTVSRMNMYNRYTTKGECRKDIIYISTISRKNIYNQYTTKGECRKDIIYTSTISPCIRYYIFHNSSHQMKMMYVDNPNTGSIKIIMKRQIIYAKLVSVFKTDNTKWIEDDKVENID